MSDQEQAAGKRKRASMYFIFLCFSCFSPLALQSHHYSVWFSFFSLSPQLTTYTRETLDSKSSNPPILQHQNLPFWFGPCDMSLGTNPSTSQPHLSPFLPFTPLRAWIAILITLNMSDILSTGTQSCPPPELPQLVAEQHVPIPSHDKDTQRLIVVLSNASLETYKAVSSGRSGTKDEKFSLLNSDEHIGIMRKMNRDISEARPDITHQVRFNIASGNRKVKNEYPLTHRSVCSLFSIPPWTRPVGSKFSFTPPRAFWSKSTLQSASREHSSGSPVWWSSCSTDSPSVRPTHRKNSLRLLRTRSPTTCPPTAARWPWVSRRPWSAPRIIWRHWTLTRVSPSSSVPWPRATTTLPTPSRTILSVSATTVLVPVLPAASSAMLPKRSGISSEKLDRKKKKRKKSRPESVRPCRLYWRRICHTFFFFAGRDWVAEWRYRSYLCICLVLRVFWLLSKPSSLYLSISLCFVWGKIHRDSYQASGFIPLSVGV